MRHAALLMTLGVVLVAGLLASAPAASAPADDLTMRELIAEVRALMTEVSELRQELAESRLRSEQAERELAELQMFIEDHAEFGRDFEQYRAVRAAAERDARRRAAEEARQRHEQEKARRDARRADLQAERSADRAEAARLGRYGDAGFSPIGLDVFVGKMAYYYNTRQETRSVLENNRDLIVYPVSQQVIDFSRMTISGSVINGSDEIRNIGVAVAFFDESGNQVGAETIQVNNARPDVPYPFTSTIEVALNRPFDTASVYVLYADAASNEAATDTP
ncbi:MAG: FxLYD domain-containing protein [Planctomycetota bacterium]|jgi:hypothetical protein